MLPAGLLGFTKREALKSQYAVARELGISRARVKQLEQTALWKLVRGLTRGGIGS